MSYEEDTCVIPASGTHKLMSASLKRISAGLQVRERRPGVHGEQALCIAFSCMSGGRCMSGRRWYRPSTPDQYMTSK